MRSEKDNKLMTSWRFSKMASRKKDGLKRIGIFLGWIGIIVFPLNITAYYHFPSYYNATSVETFNVIYIIALFLWLITFIPYSMILLLTRLARSKIGQEIEYALKESIQKNSLLDSIGEAGFLFAIIFLLIILFKPSRFFDLLDNTYFLLFCLFWIGCGIFYVVHLRRIIFSRRENMTKS